MHLGLGVPNTWYRASIVVAAGGDRTSTGAITGVTLPGTPGIIAGSNGDVAWAFTNSEVDAADLVLLEMVDAARGVYRVPEGLARLESHVERIVVRGGRDDTLVVQTCRWGPIVGRDFAGRPRALRWTAHDPAALDFRILGMERVRDVDEALALAPTCGIPPLNCVIADRGGRIGWTIMGRLPRRTGFDGRRPVSLADSNCRWDGLLSPIETPRLVDPPAGRIWTANNRIVGGAALAVLGDGGYGLGARAGQIRDALLRNEAAQPADMLRLQLDDRALFLGRWRALFLAALSPEAAAVDPRHAVRKPADLLEGDSLIFQRSDHRTAAGSADIEGEKSVCCARQV
jgi:penicillin amidase